MRTRHLTAGVRAFAVIVALLAAVAAGAHAQAPDPPPTRGESVAPPRLNPQPEPPGIAKLPDPPADGQCATCEPPGGDGGTHPTGFKPYEIEIRKVRVCDTEDSMTDEVYIKLNGVKVWGVWGLQANHTYGYGPCNAYGLNHREAVMSFAGWVNVDVFDEDWPDPDDWLLSKTVYMITQPPITTSPPQWKGTLLGYGSNYTYEIEYVIRPK